MTVKVGLLSDVHATPEPVREALQLFCDEGVETILCAGDIAGYGKRLEETIALLIEGGCRSVVGNHDLWYFEGRDADAEESEADYLRTLPTTVELDVAEKKLVMVHASPPDSLMGGIRLLDEEGGLIKRQKHCWGLELENFQADVLVVGHTHQVFAERLGSLLVVNPGSTLFNHTCAVLSVPEMAVEFFPLSGKKPVLSWNFSMFNEMRLRERQP